MAESNENDIVKKIQDSMKDMQSNMNTTYKELEGEIITGVSSEQPSPYVKVVMKANYELVDLVFTEQALQGGVKEFNFRIKTAWVDALSQIQKITQEKTMQLLQGMDLPKEITNRDDEE